MRKIYLILFFVTLSLSFNSCNDYREKTFLDFELGMTYKEYIDHASKLEKSGFIEKLDNTDFEYTIKLQNDNYAFFNVHAYVYGNSRLSMIECKSKYDLDDIQKKQLYDVFVAKNGQTSEPFEKDYTQNIWRAVWDKNDIDQRLVFIDEDKDGKWETIIHFMATGSLSDGIEQKDKKENGIIDVENKY